MVKIESFLPGIQSDGLNTETAVDFETSPSVKLPSNTTVGGSPIGGGTIIGGGTTPSLVVWTGTEVISSSAFSQGDYGGSPSLVIGSGANAVIADYSSSNVFNLNNGGSLNATLEAVGNIELTSDTGILNFSQQANTITFPLETGTVVLKNGTFNYTPVSGTYAVLTTDYVVDCTTGSFTVTLPTAAGATGKIYIIKNSGTGVITLNVTGGEKIDAVTSINLVQYDVERVMSNGANYIII